MYDYGYYDYGYEQATTGLAGLAIFSLIMWIIIMAVAVFNIIAMWKVFTKAGKPGWAAIVPIYNIIVLLEVAELPMWYIALYLIPGVNIYAMIKIYIDLSKNFGKSVGFGVGMCFFTPVFMAILAFDKNVVYKGGQVATAQPMSQPQQMNYQQPMNQSQQMSYEQPTMYETPASQPAMSEPVMPVTPEIQQPVEPTMSQSQSQQINSEPVNQEIPKFCTKCGAPTIPNTKFCTSCGNQL